MELRIDRQALVPVVQQSVDGLTEWILQSGVAPATRLPSVRQIARDNLLSQSCVVEACERLVSQGVLSACQGTGFIVAASPSTQVSSSSARQWTSSPSLCPCLNGPVKAGAPKAAMSTASQ